MTSEQRAGGEQPATTDRPWLESYPPGVPHDLDVPDVPVTRLLDDAAASFPSSAAISYSGRIITYRELVRDVDRFAGALAELGVSAGDRVMVILPNCPQHVIAMFAAIRLGAIAVPCNPLATAAELTQQVTLISPTVVVALDRAVETVLTAAPALARERVVVTSLLDYYPAARRVQLASPLPKARRQRRRLTADVPKGTRDFGRLVSRGRPARQADVEPAHDVAVLQFTGGTTGTPKAAALTHRNLVANAYQTRLWIPDATAGHETTLGVLPLFHVFGLTMCLFTTVLLAGRLVLVPRFDLDLLFDAVDDERPTLFPGVPPIFQAVADAPAVRRHDLSSIRVCISGAMKLPTATQERFEQVTGARLVEGYGTTETSPATHCNPVTGPNKTGSVGLPLPGTDARIQDGELAVHGPQVFAGYWGDDAADSDRTEDGWFLTGDLAEMDADGYFTIVGRKKDLIIAGGFNIYPNEVEDVVTQLDGVAECVVVGLPDRYRGETVKAYVVRRPDADIDERTVTAHCAERLSAYKVPKLVEFRDSLPKSAVGKALRRVLIDEELANQEQQA